MATLAAPRTFALPGLNTLINLMLGGLAALGFYEVWANWPTALFAGFPLEPPELVKALINRWYGKAPPDVWAKAIHFVTGFLLYPIGYYIQTRWIYRFGDSRDGWIFGVLTYIFALGIMAPLAGFPFLLIGDNEKLSLMSLIGHAIFGYILGLVFERFEKHPT